MIVLIKQLQYILFYLLVMALHLFRSVGTQVKPINNVAGPPSKIMDYPAQ